MFARKPLLQFFSRCSIVPSRSRSRPSPTPRPRKAARSSACATSCRTPCTIRSTNGRRSSGSCLSDSGSSPTTVHVSSPRLTVISAGLPSSLWTLTETPLGMFGQSAAAADDHAGAEVAELQRELAAELLHQFVRHAEFTAATKHVPEPPVILRHLRIGRPLFRRDVNRLALAVAKHFERDLALLLPSVPTRSTRSFISCRSFVVGTQQNIVLLEARLGGRAVGHDARPRAGPGFPADPRAPATGIVGVIAPPSKPIQYLGTLLHRADLVNSTLVAGTRPRSSARPIWITHVRLLHHSSAPEQLLRLQTRVPPSAPIPRASQRNLRHDSLLLARK